ncbi:MAG TPA: 2-aminoethylphosphonate aminotransferase, partial [Candidatus Paceibacterota bacterium]|nr:2-aminoethylphosphonate aminotransferase [Candidatus Paceibacterota bacterium]
MKKKLFNPGPTNVSEKVREAVKTEDICHREPEFREVLLRINKNIVKILNGESTHNAVLFTSSGTGCNEAICSSIHGKVLVINNGKYSDRICDILENYNLPINRLIFNPLEPINLNLIEKNLQEDKDITHIYLIHHETTTGILAPLKEIGELARKYNKILCVDAISSLGGHEFDLQKDNIAFCAVSANKCLESFPGVSFVIAKTEEIKKLEGKSRSFYFDIYNQWKKEQVGETPFTPAVQLIFALDKALQEFSEEGYKNRIERYKKLAQKMREGLKKLGFELILFPENSQSNILTTIKMPEKMDYWKVHDKLKEKGITIYSGKEVLEKRQFRIATLGHLTEEDIEWFLQNLKEVAEEEGLFNSEFNINSNLEQKQKSRVDKAIILAAGKGTRLQPQTDDIPKCLIEIEGKSLIERSLENLQNNGIKEVFIVIGYLKSRIQEKIKDKFKDMKINYVINENYESSSTMYSLYTTKGLMNNDVIIAFGDIFYDSRIIKLLIEEDSKNVLYVTTLSGTSNNAYIYVNEKNNLVNIKLDPPHVKLGLSKDDTALGEMGDIFKLSKESLEKIYKITEKSIQKGLTGMLMEEGLSILSKDIDIKCILTNLDYIGINNEKDFLLAKEKLSYRLKQKPRVDKAIILAAGKGTRLKPLTETTHKCLTEIKGKPI